MIPLLTLSGCDIANTGDVNQDRIWVRYELFFDANNGKTLAAAQFRFGGANGRILELNEQASVRFNEEELFYDDAFKAHVREFDSRIDSGAFEYTDLDKMTFTNLAELPDSIAIPETFDTIYLSHDNVLEWVGAPVGPQEHVSVLIGNGSWGAPSFFTQSEEGATSVMLDAGLLAVYPKGTSTLFLDRWTQRNAQQTTGKGGTLVCRYRGMNRLIEIVE